MSRWRIGNIGVDRVAELEGPLFPPGAVFPDFDPEILERHGDDLVPAHYSVELGLVLGTVQSYIIRTGSKTILVDTCCGNHKERPDEPPFHNLNTPYLERLAALGAGPEDVDYVLCTHLHVDHVGWNTRLENGRWVPTFPNATYIFSQADLDFLLDLKKMGPAHAAQAAQYDDSIAPIIEARKGRVIEADQALTPELEINFEPGHTPGHIILKALSKGEGALFIGDVIQHPFQLYRPNWNSVHCALPDLARSARRNVLEQCVREDLLMFPAHFANPYAFKIARREGGYALRDAAKAQ